MGIDINSTGPWEVRAVKNQVTLGSISHYPQGAFPWAARDQLGRGLGAFESHRDATQAVLESHTLSLGEIDITLI